jgi:hypothetical protein
MIKYILFLLFPLLLLSETTFITPLEYASQLYKNPRGIGCQHCHGSKGEGKLIATYVHRGEEREFRGPKLQGIEFATFFNALNKRKKGMPRYFLTKKEIQALYLHVNQEKFNINLQEVAVDE